MNIEFEAERKSIIGFYCRSGTEETLREGVNKNDRTKSHLHLLRLEINGNNLHLLFMFQGKIELNRIVLRRNKI